MLNGSEVDFGGKKSTSDFLKKPEGRVLMHQMNAKKRCGLLGRLKSQPVSNLYMGAGRMPVRQCCGGSQSGGSAHSAGVAVGGRDPGAGAGSNLGAGTGIVPCRWSSNLDCAGAEKERGVNPDGGTLEFFPVVGAVHTDPGSFAGGYLLWMTARYHAVKKKILTMQEALNPGDVVLTQSGLYGVLTSLGRTTAHLRLTNGYEIVIDRFSIKEPATAEAAQEVQTVL